MWQERSHDFEGVMQAELALLSSPVRGDEGRVTGLLADDLVLVTYRVRGAECDSRHSSLWQTRGPVLRFHQGTIIVSDR